MIKTFVYKGTEIDVKTNWLKEGNLYFGERDVRAILERTVKEVNYYKSGEATDVTYVINLYERLKSQNIKADEIRFGGLTYTGTKMTDMSQQEKIKDE